MLSPANRCESKNRRVGFSVFSQRKNFPGRQFVFDSSVKSPGTGFARMKRSRDPFDVMCSSRRQGPMVDTLNLGMARAGPEYPKETLFRAQFSPGFPGT